MSRGGCRFPHAHTGSVLCAASQLLLLCFSLSDTPTYVSFSFLRWQIWSNPGWSPCMKCLWLTCWDLANWCWISSWCSEACIFFFPLHVSPCVIWFLLLSFAKELLESMTTIDTPIQFTLAFFFSIQRNFWNTLFLEAQRPKWIKHLYQQRLDCIKRAFGFSLNSLQQEYLQHCDLNHSFDIF